MHHQSEDPFLSTVRCDFGWDHAQQIRIQGEHTVGPVCLSRLTIWVQWVTKYHMRGWVEVPIKIWHFNSRSLSMSEWLIDNCGVNIYVFSSFGYIHCLRAVSWFTGSEDHLPTLLILFVAQLHLPRLMKKIFTENSCGLYPGLPQWDEHVIKENEQLTKWHLVIIIYETPCFYIFDCV